MSNFERKYSPGYRRMICIGKTKSTSQKGLLFSKLVVYLFNLNVLFSQADLVIFSREFSYAHAKDELFPRVSARSEDWEKKRAS